MKLKILILAAASLASCSPYPDLSGLLTETKVQTLSEDGRLALESRPLEKAGEYAVVVKWSLDESASARPALFRNDGKKRIFIKSLTEREGLWWDMPLASDAQFFYEIVAEDGTLLSQARVSTGRDLIVEGEMGLPQDYSKISRVFFEPNAVLLTEGVPIDWALSEWHGAPGARFVSFLRNRPARAGYIARNSSGGTLSLKRAFGVTQVEWRGETGNQGEAGRTNPDRGSLGRKGYDGRNHGACTARPGEDGGKGPAGYQGGKGGDGGDMETLEISVASGAADFQIVALVEAGAPGPGGNGGDGGRGGPGGAGGKESGSDCSDAPAGSEGPRGSSGPLGEEGRSGEVRGTLCLREGGGASCRDLRQGLKSSP
ncbi:MAG: hypothetical protein ABIR96_01645 [Bdellovibrionota bacterium]